MPDQNEYRPERASHGDRGGAGNQRRAGGHSRGGASDRGRSGGQSHEGKGRPQQPYGDAHGRSRDGSGRSFGRGRDSEYSHDRNRSRNDDTRTGRNRDGGQDGDRSERSFRRNDSGDGHSRMHGDRNDFGRGDRDRRSGFDRGPRRDAGGRRGAAAGAPRHERPRRAPRAQKRVAVSPARRAALQVGKTLRERDAFAQDLIAKHIDASRMSREDRAFATRLVLGVVSARGTLDEIIDRSMNSPEDANEDVRDALRIAVYEMYFLDKAPHAAVDQCVELVRTFEPRACGLANAVLRKAAALKQEFPFGDPRTNLEAFARQHAFPTWLAKRLIVDLGQEAARDLMAESNEPAPLFVAVNPARAADEEVCSELQAAHGEPCPVEIDGREIPGCYRVSSGRVLQDGRIKRMINQGKLFVSDAASQEVARLVLPDALPQSFLEIGAGRATKTLLLQGDALRAYGAQIPQYVTVDNHEFKTRLLRERTEAYGIQVAEACTADATKLDQKLGDRLFDVVFVDAPCSGLGTLRRHPEIRWRLQEEDIDKMADAGLALLKSAAAQVAPGGTLAYATCTVTHAENNGVVMRFLESPEGAAFALAPVEGKGCFATRLQSGSPDAHFAVKMVRAGQ